MSTMFRPLVKIAIAAGALLFSTATMVANAPGGIVTVADNAHVDGANAALGANVYSGDSLDTEQGGTMRLRLGDGQLYMLAMTTATLSQDNGRVNALLSRGTAGFSANASDPVEVGTSVGVLRPAAGSRAYGQVTVVGPEEVRITAYEGNLVLSRDGEERMIEAGKSFNVSLAPDDDAAPQVPEGTGTHHHHDHKHWLFRALVIGGSLGGGILIYHHFEESCYHVHCG